jgi:hypothetical protein
MVGLHMGTTPMLMEMNHVFANVCVEHIKTHYAEDYSIGVQDEAAFTADTSFPDLISSEII